MHRIDRFLPAGHALGCIVAAAPAVFGAALPWPQRPGRRRPRVPLR